MKEMMLTHLNGRGTGAQLGIWDEIGGLYVSLTGQKGKVLDYDTETHFPLDLEAIGKVIQVLRGETESIEDGKGLFARSDNGHTVLRLRHRIEPVPGYEFEMLSTMGEGKDEMERRLHFIATPAEAIAIQFALEGYLAHLLVVEH